MTFKAFKPKGEDEIRQETINNYGLDPESDSEKIDKIVADRLKDENFKASEKEKNARLKAELKNQTKAKEFYKAGGKNNPGNNPKGDDKPKGEEDKFVTRDEFAAAQHRQRYNYLDDDTYNFINAQAKGSDITFEKAVELPIVKGHLESINVQGRINRATTPPNSRIAPSKSKVITDEQREIAIKSGNNPEEVYKD